MAPSDGDPPPPGPRSHHGRHAPRGATATLTKGRSLRKKIGRKRHAAALNASVATLDSISEDEESLTDGDIDKDMAYAVHIDPNATLGDEAAVAALFVEDTDEVGILEPTGTDRRDQTDPDGASKPTTAATTGEGKVMRGAAPTAIQDRLVKAFCGDRAPPPPHTTPTTKSNRTERSNESATDGGKLPKQVGGESFATKSLRPRSRKSPEARGAGGGKKGTMSET